MLEAERRPRMTEDPFAPFSYDVGSDQVSIRTVYLKAYLEKLEKRIKSLESSTPRRCPLCHDFMRHEQSGEKELWLCARNHYWCSE